MLIQIPFCAKTGDYICHTGTFLAEHPLDQGGQYGLTCAGSGEIFCESFYHIQRTDTAFHRCVFDCVPSSGSFWQNICHTQCTDVVFHQYASIDGRSNVSSV